MYIPDNVRQSASTFSAPHPTATILDTPTSQSMSLQQPNINEQSKVDESTNLGDSEVRITWMAEGSTDAWNEKMEKGWHQRRWVQRSRAVFGFSLACDGVVGSCCSSMASQISSLVSLSSGGMYMNMLCLGMRSHCPRVVRHARFRGSIRIGEKRRKFFCDTPLGLTRAWFLSWIPWRIPPLKIKGTSPCPHS